MPSTLVLMCGPPLPGRWTLARIVEQQLGARRVAECVERHASLLARELTGDIALVLVVDDDAEQRRLLADVLHELGFGVELAPDAGVALALLEDGAHVDVLITDQRMPGMTGIELTRELRRRHPEVRSVLLTAYG